jgi:hypothetical protein
VKRVMRNVFHAMELVGVTFAPGLSLALRKRA